LTYSKLEEPKRQSLNAIIPVMSYSAKSKSYNVGGNNSGLSGMAKRHPPDLFEADDDSNKKLPLGRHSVSVMVKSKGENFNRKDVFKSKISHEQITKESVNRKSNN
jgi:hypothetical protein